MTGGKKKGKGNRRYKDHDKGKETEVKVGAFEKLVKQKLESKKKRDCKVAEMWESTRLGRRRSC